MKVKLDRHKINVLVNGLFQMREYFEIEQRNTIDSVILNTIDTVEKMRPKKKAWLHFNAEEKRLIRRCLIEWRNAFVLEGKDAVAEEVARLIIKL